MAHFITADSSTHTADSTLWTADGLCSIPSHSKVGGDDRLDRGHRGWDKRRATLKRDRDREFTAQIRDIYRELTGDPRTAERAEEIVAPVVTQGRADTALDVAIQSRAEELRRRADALDAGAMQAEIALRLLYREMRERQEAEDFEAVRVLLAEVL